MGAVFSKQGPPVQNGRVGTYVEIQVQHNIIINHILLGYKCYVYLLFRKFQFRWS